MWQSVDLSDPGFSLSTPALTPEGQPFPKPHWKVASEPARIIQDMAEVDVVTRKEVKRFHVALRTSGLKLQLTDGATRRVRAAVAKAEGASFHFDYETQEAIITVPDQVVQLGLWHELATTVLPNERGAR